MANPKKKERERERKKEITADWEEVVGGGNDPDQTLGHMKTDRQPRAEQVTGEPWTVVVRLAYSLPSGVLARSLQDNVKTDKAPKGVPLGEC